MNESICFRMCLNVSVFHAESLSNNPTRKVAHSLQYPIDGCHNNRMTLPPGLVVVYNLPSVGRGLKLRNEVQDTAPEFTGFGM